MCSLQKVNGWGYTVRSVPRPFARDFCPFAMSVRPRFLSLRPVRSPFSRSIRPVRSPMWEFVSFLLHYILYFRYFHTFNGAFCNLYLVLKPFTPIQCPFNKTKQKSTPMRCWLLVICIMQWCWLLVIWPTSIWCVNIPCLCHQIQGVVWSQSWFQYRVYSVEIVG